MANQPEKELQEHDKVRLDYFSHSVGKGIASAFDSMFSVILRHAKTQGRSRKLVIPSNNVPLNLTIKPGTLSVTIQAIGGYLDGSTITVGDGFSYTYPSGSKTAFDTINLPIPGMEVYIQSSSQLQISVLESPFPHSKPVSHTTLSGPGTTSANPIFTSTSLTDSNATTNIVSSGNLVPWGDGSSYAGGLTAKAQVIPSFASPSSGPWYALYSSGDNSNGTNAGQVGVWHWNGSTWDKVRVIPGATGASVTPTSGMYTVGITTATTTVVKASAGVIGTISNASGAATGAITVYNNTSATGTVVWTGTLAAGQVLQLGLPCGTGITVVTAAADAIAVSYA